MSHAEVIDAAQQEHGGVNRLGSASQSAGATGKTVKSLTKGGIEAFNVGSVDDAALLGRGEQVREQGLCALHNAPLYGQDCSLTTLDHLRDEQVRPRAEVRSSALPRVNGGAKSLSKGPHITLPAIDRQQEGTLKGDGADVA